MKIKLFNSLNGQKQDFIPLDSNNIKIYVCGPTVYSYPHIGNARSAVIYDLLFRFFLAIFPKVTYVRNITDVDDKINAAAKESGVKIEDITAKFTKVYHDDMEKLGVLKPTFEPRATQNISEMIAMIQKLIENQHAYESEGHILFDVDSYSDYGRLSNRSTEDMIAGARIEKQGYKKNPMDFVLWKPASKDDDISAIFNSPWGKGRPGWHIECSAMSHNILGEEFDIHGGGADLKFPHHDNEIAQSKCAYPNSNHARFWIHNGFLTVDGEKMSKSLNNFITVRDLLEKGISGVVIRYLLLSTHYRKPLDFTEQNLQLAKKAIEKFYEIIANFKDDNLSVNSNENHYLISIKEALADDLNSPLAFATLHQLVKDIKKSNQEDKKILVKYLVQSLEFLGFYSEEYIAEFSSNSKSQNNNNLESSILEQIELRKQAKIDKNWQLSDKIRDDLLNKFNVILEDKPNGLVEWKFKN